MRKVLDFNSGWDFFKGDAAMEELRGVDWQRVDLPHTFNALDGQDGGNDYYQGPVWYRKKFDAAVLPDGFRENVYIRFGAASKRADVYLNGVSLGRHDGGFSAFTFDMSEALSKGENELLVRVDNSRDLPVYPIFADFTFFGGLYREVRIICFDTPLHFRTDEYGVDALWIIPGKEEVNIRFAATAEKCALTAVIYDICEGEKKEVARNTVAGEALEAAEEITLPVSCPHLWNGTDDAHLYEAVLTMTSGEGESSVLDEISAAFGFRDFNVDREEGFFLNGRSYPLRGVCRHQDRENMGWAIGKSQHEQDMALIREMGANTVRLAHYQQAPYFYDLCDREGMVVWAEIPFISGHDNRKESDDNLKSQLKELIMQNYNHPSICFWGIANEIGIGGETPEMYRILSELNALAKELDSTRLTTVANVGMTATSSPLFHSSDVATYNEYKGWYEGTADDHGSFADEKHAELKNVPLGISEYGAEAVMKWHSAEPRIKDYSEEYQALVHKKAMEAFAQRPYLWGTWLWNMFDFAADQRDEGGCRGRNNKGLVTYDRKTRKEAFYLYKALWSKNPFVYVCGKRFTKRYEEKVRIRAYSNIKELTLCLNGECIQTLEGEHCFEFDPVSLPKGDSEIIVRGGNLEDKVVFTRVDEIPAEYVYREDKNISEAVTQWFATVTEGGAEKSVLRELVVNEGFLSVYDPLEEVYRYHEGYKAIQELVARPMSLINPSMADRMKTGGAMSFHSIWNHISKMFPDDLIYVVNERLNKIKK